MMTNEIKTTNLFKKFNLQFFTISLLFIIFTSACVRYLLVKPALADTPPVAQYNLDEGSGSNTYNFINSQYYGTLNGATWTTGKIGKAVSFNGSSSTVTTNQDLDINGSFTLEAWVYPTKTIDGAAIIAKGGGSTTNYALDLRNSNSIGFFIYDNGGNAYGITGTTTQKVQNNVWSHVVGVYDASSTPNFKVYLNGAQINETANWTGTMVNNNVGLSIGYRPTTRFFGGSIDQVKVYNYPLSAAQVQADYNQTTQSPTNTPLTPTLTQTPTTPTPTPTGPTPTPALCQSPASCTRVGGTCSASTCSGKTRANGDNCGTPGTYCCVPIDNQCSTNGGTLACSTSSCQTASPYGTCQSTSKYCYGGYVSNRCPGSSTFKCCLQVTSCPKATPTSTLTPTPTPPTPTSDPTHPTIVLDPGHSPSTCQVVKDGLVTGGAAGEMAINWTEANLLKPRLQAMGYNIVMTKQNLNDCVSDKQRAEIANQNNAALMFRIHMNSTGAACNYFMMEPNVTSPVTGLPTASLITTDWAAARVIIAALDAAKIGITHLGTTESSYIKPDSYGGNSGMDPNCKNLFMGSCYSQVPVSLIELAGSDCAFLKSTTNLDKAAAGIATGIKNFVPIITPTP